MNITCYHDCDMIYEKGPLLIHIKNSFFYDTWYYHEHIYMYVYKTVLWDVLTVVLFHKSHHKCLPEVVPWGKSDHINIMTDYKLFIKNSMYYTK